MRTLLILICVVCLGAAPNPPDVWAANPWREVNGKLCHLQPLYDYLNRGGDRSVKEKNPMLAWTVFHRARVLQVLSDGLMVERIEFGAGLRAADRVVMVRNFPTDGIVDEQRLKFVAMPAGTWSGTSTEGARLTRPAFDYGIPVAAPKEKARP